MVDVHEDVVLTTEMELVREIISTGTIEVPKAQTVVVVQTVVMVEVRVIVVVDSTIGQENALATVMVMKGKKMYMMLKLSILRYDYMAHMNPY